MLNGDFEIEEVVALQRQVVKAQVEGYGMVPARNPALDADVLDPGVDGRLCKNRLRELVGRVGALRVVVLAILGDALALVNLGNQLVLVTDGEDEAGADGDILANRQ